MRPELLIADVGDARELAFLDEVGDLDREVVGVDLVGQFGDDEARATLHLFDADDGTHRDRAATRAVGILDAFDPEDLRTGREVGALDALDEGFEQLFARGVGVLERPQRSIGHLAQIVRRDVGRHADRDADRAVDEEVGESRRQNPRFLSAAVVVVLHIDGVFVDVADHLHGERRHLGLGVPVGGGAIVAGGSEVALPESERVAQRPRLDESNEGVVDRAVAVRVELPHHVADDAGALREGTVGTVAPVVHRVDHAAVHGLEPVAHVGQRAPDDHAHRVVEVAALHLELEVDLLDLVVALGIELGHVCHVV